MKSVVLIINESQKLQLIFKTWVDYILWIIVLNKKENRYNILKYQHLA